MIYRCTNEKHPQYKDYGGRGITVCREWMDVNVFFDWSIKNGFLPELEIDRIENDKGYSPDNCRWTTRSVNVNNRRKRTA